MDIKKFLSTHTKGIEPHILASDIILTDVSDTIVKRRFEIGLTQKELADKTGISQSMISKWESCDYNFTIEQLCKAAYYLDLDISIKLTQKKKIGGIVLPEWNLATETPVSVDTVSKYNLKSTACA